MTFNLFFYNATFFLWKLCYFPIFRSTENIFDCRNQKTLQGDKNDLPQAYANHLFNEMYYLSKKKKNSGKQSLESLFQLKASHCKVWYF